MSDTTPVTTASTEGTIIIAIDNVTCTDPFEDRRIQELRRAQFERHLVHTEKQQRQAAKKYYEQFQKAFERRLPPDRSCEIFRRPPKRQGHGHPPLKKWEARRR